LQNQVEKNEEIMELSCMKNQPVGTDLRV